MSIGTGEEACLCQGLHRRGQLPCPCTLGQASCALSEPFGWGRCSPSFGAQPGISEALFATAIGLVAAIPAAVAYNKLSSDLNRYGNRLDAFVSEFSSIISRQLEEHN